VSTRRKRLLLEQQVLASVEARESVLQALEGQKGVIEMVRAIKNMFGGSAGYVGKGGKVKADTLFFRTGVNMKKKTFSGLETVKIRDLKFKKY